MQLRFVNELSPAKFAELGRPIDAWRRSDGQVVALASELDLLYWPGRAVYEGHRLRHRLSVYDENLTKRHGVFDRARFPITDVAFHPSRPLVAVGTGRYDGGYQFEGDLWLWNWQTDEVRNVLGESRDVAACRWVDDERLAVLLRPRDEEEHPPEFDAFDTYVGLVLDDLTDQHRPTGPGFHADPRLVGLEPIHPASLGFRTPPHHNERRPRFDEVLGAMVLEERSRVWDVMWLSPELLAVVHDHCRVEVWNTRTAERTLDIRGEGHGVQLTEALGSPLVNVLCGGSSSAEEPRHSTLYRLGPDGLEELRTFDRPVVMSTNGSGDLLCRDPGDLRRSKKRSDIVLSSSNQEVLRTNLGHYDCFNHYLRLDGQDADGLYFLRGTPASSHQHKYLCRVKLDGSVEELMKWDDQRSHMMNSTACWAAPRSIVRSCRVYNPQPGAGVNLIERRDLYADQARWAVHVDAPATDLVCASDLVVYALTNGTVGVLDAKSGEERSKTTLDVDGVPTFATALAAHGDVVAMGSVDGRVLLFQITR